MTGSFVTTNQWQYSQLLLIIFLLLSFNRTARRRFYLFRPTFVEFSKLFKLK